MTDHTVKGVARRVLVWFAKGAAAIVAAIVACVLILLLVMWSEHRTGIALPVPTGPFAVGRTAFAWTNAAETDDLASAPGSQRHVQAWVWYPAVRSSAGTPADYLPAAWRAALEARQGMFMRKFFKRDSSLVRCHSLSDARVLPEPPTFPVVLLRAGGSALTTDFTTLAEDLASHGFIVVGFDAPYRSFVFVRPDGTSIARSPAYNVENAEGNLADPIIGKLLAMWTADTRFVVDQLERLNDEPSGRFSGRMDLQRLGMFGHSFGGATALQFCHEDSRCKAALDLDGIPFGSVVRDGLAKPGMFLLSDHSNEMADPASRQVLAEIQSICERLPNGRLFLVIRTANHFSFSDQILLNSHAAMSLLRLVGFRGLDGRRGLAISADYVRTFFEVSLNGAPAASLTSLAGKYSEIQVQGK